MRNLTGKHLNELWGVGANHALYEADGKWYHRLLAFPGALFDANGYVLFETERDYLESPYLHIHQGITIWDGISSMPNYVRVTEYGQLQAFSHKIKEAAKKKRQAVRGKKRPPYAATGPMAVDMPQGDEGVGHALGQTYRSIRDTQVSKWVKYLHAYKCQLCGETIRLPDGQFYAEAHHLQPLGGLHNGPDVVENVICVCPKHHVLLDYGVISLKRSQLQMIPGHEINDAYIAYHNSHRVKPTGSAG
jgi:5-methylcytosine-specific restriction protein A